MVSRSLLFGAAAIAANDMWAVGYTAGYRLTPMRPLVEHFDGTSWSVVATPTLKQASSFAGVAAVASNDVWAVGVVWDGGSTGSQPLIEHWDGTSWSVVAGPKLPPNSSLSGVTAPAANNAWVVGTTAGSSNALVEHWDGKSWKIVSSRTFTDVLVSTIAADASTDVWAFGASITTGNPEALHFNGTTWTAMPVATSGGVVFKVGGLTALSPTDVWAAGGITAPDHVPLVPAAEHWDGTSWSLVSVPNPNPGAIYYDITLSGIAAIAAHDIWAVGSFANANNVEQTLTEHWDGTSWSIIPTPTDGFGFLKAVSARSDGTVVAVGYTSANVPLIYQNAASAPKAPTLAAQVTTTATPATASTTTLPASPLNAAAVDQVFAATVKADPLPLGLARPRARAHQAADPGARDLFPGDIRWWDRA
jgi:hypothetical protein